MPQLCNKFSLFKIRAKHRHIDHSIHENKCKKYRGTYKFKNKKIIFHCNISQKTPPSIIGTLWTCKSAAKEVKIEEFEMRGKMLQMVVTLSDGERVA